MGDVDIPIRAATASPGTPIPFTACVDRTTTPCPQTIIPYVPTDTPRLSRLVYEMILAHFLTHDRPVSELPHRKTDNVVPDHLLAGALADHQRMADDDL